MRSYVAGAVGVLSLVAAALLMNRVSSHSYRIILHAVNSVEKLDLSGGRFEVDDGYRTEFVITSDADVPLDFMIDGRMGEPCRIRFEDPGDFECQSKRLTITKGADPVKVYAGVKPGLPPDDFYNPMFGAPLYPSAVMVGAVSGALAAVDPDLELERENRLAELIAIIVALVSFVVAWRLQGR